MPVVLPSYPQQPAPAWVSRFVGLPYEEGGRGPDLWDCWGIYWLVVGEQFGCSVPAYEGVHWGPDRNREARRLTRNTIVAERQQWAEIEPGKEEPGDCIVLTIAGQPLHCGIIVSPGLMLHGTEGSDSAVERYDGMFWRNRVDGFYRPRGLQ